MKPIRIINNSFDLQGEVDAYSSLQWIRRWHKPGEFELHINPEMQNADKLQEDMIIFLADKPDEAGIIKHREINLNDDGIEVLVVKGSKLAGLTSRRITYPPAGKAYDYINAPIETIMKHYVNANCIAPSDVNRRIPNLINAANLARGTQIQHQSRYKQLEEELEKISLASGIGWTVRLDVTTQKYVFDTLVGRDLTTNQSSLPPAIFSIEYDNIESQSYMSSAIGYKNFAVVGGQGEGINRKIVTIGNQSGLERYETFIDARDIGTEESGQEPLTNTQIEQMLATRGNQRLAEAARVESFESKVLTDSNLVYRSDYDLGDLVTVLNKRWGVVLHTRITEIKEIYEPDGFELEATYGNSIPTFTEKVKRELNGRSN